MIGKRDVEAKLLSGTADTAGRSTPDPDMFQQLPINESRQQQSYALISRNKTMDSKYVIRENHCIGLKFFKNTLYNLLLSKNQHIRHFIFWHSDK